MTDTSIPKMSIPSLKPIKSLEEFSSRYSLLPLCEAAAVRRLLNGGFIAAAIYLVEDATSKRNEGMCDE